MIRLEVDKLSITDTGITKYCGAVSVRYLVYVGKMEESLGRNYVLVHSENLEDFFVFIGKFGPFIFTNILLNDSVSSFE